jgi:hypothetical protein
MTTQTIQIHASTIPSYADCPRRSAAKAFGRLATDAGFEFKKSPAGIGAAVGTAVHSAADYIMQEKIKTDVLGNLKNAVEIGIEGFKKEISDGVVWDTSTENQNAAEKQIDRLSNSFYAEIAPIIKPKNTEINYRAAIAEGFELTGRIDLEDCDESVHDWKTGAVLHSYHGQMGCYSLLKKSVALIPKELIIHYLPRVSIKKNYPGAQHIPYDRALCERAAWATLQIIMRDIKNFRRTQNPWSFAANPMSMLCSEKFCPAYKTQFCEMGGC